MTDAGPPKMPITITASWTVADVESQRAVEHALEGQRCSVTVEVPTFTVAERMSGFTRWWDQFPEGVRVVLRDASP